MTRKQKVIRSSFKMFLNWCKYYDVAVIRFFYDYGYSTIYANAISHKDGLNVRIETRAAKIKFCNEFAEKCRKHGYTVHLPIDNRKVNEMLNKNIKTVIE